MNLRLLYEYQIIYKKENLEPILKQIFSTHELIFENSSIFVSGDYINNSIILIPLLNSKNVFVGIVELFSVKSLILYLKKVLE